MLRLDQANSYKYTRVQQYRETFTNELLRLLKNYLFLKAIVNILAKFRNY